MDKGGEMGGPAANSSSDFVSPLPSRSSAPVVSCNVANMCPGAQIIQVSRFCEVCCGERVVANQSSSTGCWKTLHMRASYVGEKAERVLWSWKYTAQMHPHALPQVTDTRGRTRNSQSSSSRNTSSTATLPVSSDSSTNMTFTRSDRTMRITVPPHMAPT
jgi:hypothetical protein